MNGVNLLPLAHRLAAANRRHATVGSAIGAVAVAASVAAILILRDGGQDARQFQERLVRLGQSTAEAQAEFDKLRADRLQLQKRWRTVEILGSTPDWGVLLGVLGHARSAEIMLERCELAPDSRAAKISSGLPPERFTLELTGLADSPDAVLNYAVKLQRTGIFQRVDPPETKPAVFEGEEKSSFKLLCTLSPLPRSAHAEVSPQ